MRTGSETNQAKAATHRALGDRPMSVGVPWCAIRVAARRTGLSIHVIRAWERRYATVSPSRTVGAQRLFSEWEIQRLILLRQATENGHRIGEVSSLEMDVLYALVARDTLPGLEAVPRIPYSSSKLRTMALAAASALDAGQLLQTLLQGTRSLDVPALFDELVGPLLCELEALHESGTLRTVSQRFALAQVRSFLGRLLRDHSDDSPSYLVHAVGFRQADELQTLMAAATAKNVRCGTTYLGSDLPTQDIVRAVTSCKAHAVVVGVHSPPRSEGLDRYVAELRQDLPVSIPIVISGACGPELAVRIVRQGVEVAPAFGDLSQFLREACLPALEGVSL